MKNIILYQPIWFFLIFFLSSCNMSEETDKEIYLVFRFDDYSATSNTELEKRIVNAFKENNLSFTLGAIPFVAEENLFSTSDQKHLPLSTTKGNILKKALDEGVLEVALHGYSHQTIYESDFRSEFSGLEYDLQKEKIKKGKSYIENITGTKINTFIPPWNSYDMNTLSIIDELGFTNISADRFGILDTSSKINFFPSTCNILQVKDAINSSRKSSEEKVIIIALFHEYDFIESNRPEGILAHNDLVEILNWVSNQKDLKVMNINELSLRILHSEFDYRYILNKKTLMFSNFIPPLFSPPLDSTHASTTYYSTVIAFLTIYYFFIFGIALILTIILSLLIFTKSKYIYSLQKYIGILFLILSLILLTFKSQPGYKVMTIVAITAAINIGTWIVIYKKRTMLKKQAQTQR